MTLATKLSLHRTEMKLYRLTFDLYKLASMVKLQCVSVSQFIVVLVMIFFFERHEFFVYTGEKIRDNLCSRWENNRYDSLSLLLYVL